MPRFWETRVPGDLGSGRPGFRETRVPGLPGSGRPGFREDPGSGRPGFREDPGSGKTRVPGRPGFREDPGSGETRVLGRPGFRGDPGSGNPQKTISNSKVLKKSHGHCIWGFHLYLGFSFFLLESLFVVDDGDDYCCSSWHPGKNAFCC